MTPGAILTALYLTILLALFFYGMNCFVLAYLAQKGAKKAPRTPLSRFPFVTVQLPLFNERYVVTRLLESVSRLDYPRDRLEVQVLDDSTDETSQIVGALVEKYRRDGLNIRHLRREGREGYKAGALAAGLAEARGEFIVLLDADFLPPEKFLREVLPPFEDPRVGMVQARWGHLNREASLLTEAQAIGIDGHFLVEQRGRSASGLFLNFNGTAGVWRRACIEDAGGWEGDTLTEDLDLSYRAQLRGWKMVLLPDVVCPAEIPPQVNAFRRQQFRWAKGSIQCARKLLPRVLRSEARPFQKFEAFLHLTYYSVHPLLVALLLLTLPLLLLGGKYVFYFKLFGIAALGPPFLYALSQRELFPRWGRRLLYLPVLTVLGIGLSSNNTRAVLEALLGRRGEFERTPKFGLIGRSGGWRDRVYRLPFDSSSLLELLLALYASYTFYTALRLGNYFILPFLALYLLGYSTLYLLTLGHSLSLKEGRLWKGIQTNRALGGALLLFFALRLYRASHIDPFEDSYHHWLISAGLLLGRYSDPFYGMEGAWLPGYHLFSALLLKAFGWHNLAVLKGANILLSAGTLLLVYRLAGRYGPHAAFLFALNPIDILTSSMATAEPLMTFLSVLGFSALKRGKEGLSGLSFFLASTVRYEAWLLWAFSGLAYRRLRLLAPAIAVALLWLAGPGGSTLTYLASRTLEERVYETTLGIIPEDALGRTLTFSLYTLSSGVPLFGLAFLDLARRRRAWRGFPLLYLFLLLGVVGLGLATGSHRYLHITLPFLCLAAAREMGKDRRVALAAFLLTLLTAAYFFGVFAKLEVLNEPLRDAGAFVSGADGRVLIDSPVAAYFSGLRPDRIYGSHLLPDGRKEALAFLREEGIRYLVVVDVPYYKVNRLFPEIWGEGASSLFKPAFYRDYWQYGFGAKRVEVLSLSAYRVFSTGSYLSSSPRFADLDGDGEMEIIAASDRLYAWEADGSPLPGFPVPMKNLVASTPTVEDIDGDGRPEVFVGSDDDRLHGFRNDGRPLEGFPKETGNDVFSDPLLVDLDRDGREEVVVGSDDGRVYAWHLDGSSVKGWPVETQGYVSASPTAADLDGDGRQEVLVGSWDGRVYAWRADGTLYEGFPLETGDAVWARVFPADLNGDGVPEIVAASDRVYAWDSRGRLLPGFPVRLGASVTLSLEVGDLDGDGEWEIIAGADRLYVIDARGQSRRGWPVETGAYVWARPRLSDLDGDGSREILVGDLEGRLHAYRADGTSIEGFPLAFPGRIFASVDVDAEGSRLLVGVWDRNVYLLDWREASREWHLPPYAPPPPSSEIRGDFGTVSLEEDPSGVVFAHLKLTRADLRKGKLVYLGDDGTWHFSPLLLSGEEYLAIIPPQRGPNEYYLALWWWDGTYQRVPVEGTLHLQREGSRDR
jgi:cellulose synthase/poly-beta-1,6-N-acetylglucosamine synthase-like glycosyltransferase